MDILGTYSLLSVVERLSSFGDYQFHRYFRLSVVNREVCPLSECSLSVAPLLGID